MTLPSRRAIAFGRDTSGSIGPLFALMAIPLLGLALTAVDYSRARGIQSALQVAIDSAAGAASSKLGGPRNEVEETAKGYLKANLPEGFKDLPYQLTYGPGGNSVSISIEGRMPTTLIAIAGVRSMDISVATTAAKPLVPQLPASLDDAFSHPRPSPQVLDGPKGLSQADAEAIQKQFGLQKPPSVEEIQEAQRQVQELLRELDHAGVDHGELRRLMHELR